jgi:hypothetical protein
MWYHPAAFFLGKRDVIGAWLICLALVMAFFGYPVVTTALDVWAGDHYTATAGPKSVR